MKKNLTFIGIFVAVSMLLSACEGPMGPQGPAGFDGQDGQVTKMIIDYRISENDWVPVYDNNNLFLYYVCFIEESELTENIYNNGAIVPYLEVIEDGFLVQKMLPYNIVGEDQYGPYTWYVDFDYTVGEVGFYIKNSVFLETLPPVTWGTMTFRVIFLW